LFFFKQAVISGDKKTLIRALLKLFKWLAMARIMRICII